MPVPRSEQAAKAFKNRGGIINIEDVDDLRYRHEIPEEVMGKPAENPIRLSPGAGLINAGGTGENTKIT